MFISKVLKLLYIVFAIYFQLNPLIMADEPIPYSINLMWINERLDPDQKYLFPALNESDINEKFLNRITEWADLTKKDGIIYLWYDGQFTSKISLENVQKILEKKASFHPEWTSIFFKDIRNIPEVKKHPEVFSENTPIYFRVDLLKILTSYYTLVQGKEQYFVLSDLDMKPLSKDLLLDEKTKNKLDEFGMVVARSGHDCNSQRFENSFHIISNQKPNLLKAIKEAIIDINILRALYTLNGDYSSSYYSNSVRLLNESVYYSYRNMFYYFYHLEGWADPENKESSLITQFGLRQIKDYSILPKKKNIIIDKSRFCHHTGKEENIKTIRIPTKIVDVPLSFFGSFPTATFDPDKISIKNYYQKIIQSLDRKNKFDIHFLFLAVRNNYIKEIFLIIDKLSPAELAEAFFYAKSKYNFQEEYSFEENSDLNEFILSNFSESFDNRMTSFDAALEEGNYEIIQIITDKLSLQPEIFAQVAEFLVEYFSKNQKNFLYQAAKKKHVKTLEILSNQFSKYPNLLSIIAKILKEQ